jgi:hypothetical protein
MLGEREEKKVETEFKVKMVHNSEFNATLFLMKIMLLLDG